MNLNTFVAKIMGDYAQNISPHKIIEYFDECQRSILLDNTWGFVYVNENDPEWPYPHIVTETNKLVYEIPTVGLRDSQGTLITLEMFGTPVEAVRVESVFLGEGAQVQGGAYGLETGLGTGETELASRTMVTIPFRSIPRSNNNPPKILLNNALPGGTKLYMEIAIAPYRIESIKSPVFVDLDRFEVEMADGVRGRIEKATAVRSELWDKFEQLHIPEIRSYYNGRKATGENTSVGYTVV